MIWWLVFWFSFLSTFTVWQFDRIIGIEVTLEHDDAEAQLLKVLLSLTLAGLSKNRVGT